MRVFGSFLPSLLVGQDHQLYLGMGADIVMESIALIDNGFRFWVLGFSCQLQWWNRNEHWAPCHKRVPAVVVECIEAVILAPFLKHLRAGVVFSASG